MGLITGLLLGCLNTFVILSVYPHLGYDINFLKITPMADSLLSHGPLVHLYHAFFVELNFRGFLLGRLAALESGSGTRLPTPLAFGSHRQSLIFAFDPSW